MIGSFIRLKILKRLTGHCLYFLTTKSEFIDPANAEIYETHLGRRFKLFHDILFQPQAELESSDPRCSIHVGCKYTLALTRYI